MSDEILDAYYSLGKDINKAKGETTPETEQGVVGEKLPELKLSMSNEDLLKLTEQWTSIWENSKVYSEWKEAGQANEDYWKGKQYSQPKIDRRRPLIDNILFQSLETYLPQVTQQNPEPLVTLDSNEMQTPENLAFATDLKNHLGDIADTDKLRLKLKKGSRHHQIYLLGVLKHTWDLDNNVPTSKAIRPWKIILDPGATVDEDGYTGNRIGEHRKMQADKMLDTLERIGGETEGIAKIKEMLAKDLGSEVGFIEWWTNEFFAWTLGDKGNGEVLLKKKNPHWNYKPEPVAAPQVSELPAQPTIPGQDDQNQLAVPNAQPAPTQPLMGSNDQMPEPPQPDFSVTAEEQVPEVSTVSEEEEEELSQLPPNVNHLPSPRMPYTFIVMYMLGDQPVDNTSLMGQNLASQDLINKRLRQIDKNADSMNGGMVVSLELSGLSQQQAKGVTEALRRGGTIAIPAGNVNDAIARMSAPALPETIYTQLNDTRSRVQYIYGVHGFTPTQGGGQNAVRSQILNKNIDESRISGGFAEILEQAADDTYQYWIQLMYVYDERYAGKPHPKVRVTVKEGSLLPKDATAKAQQATNLATAGKMSLLDLYKTLEFPNPEEMAANVWLEANAPEVLLSSDPRVAQVVQQKQQAQQAAQQAEAAKNAPEKKVPSESIAFKDLPPEGKAQMAAQAGIQLHPEAIAAHDDVVHQRSKAPTPPAPVALNDLNALANPPQPPTVPQP